jgi:hypothetical protein
MLDSLLEHGGWEKWIDDLKQRASPAGAGGYFKILSMFALFDDHSRPLFWYCKCFRLK